MLSLGRISCNPTLSGLDSEGDIDGKWQKILSGLAVFFYTNELGKYAKKFGERKVMDLIP